MERNYKTRMIVSTFGLVLLITMVVSISYAAFEYTKKGETINSIRTAKVAMSYTEGQNGIEITDAIPMEDEVGMGLSGVGKVFDFTVKIEIPGRGISGIGYEVTAEKQVGSTLNNNDVKLYLERSDDSSNWTAVDDPSYYVPLETNDSFGAQVGEMVLDTVTSSSTKTCYYRLRMWVDKDYEASMDVKTFQVKVNVYGSDTATSSKAYNVAIRTNNVTTSSSSVKVTYNADGNVTITPQEHYYLSDVTCSTGYTTDATVGESAINSQNIKIMNSGVSARGTCTFTAAGRTGYETKPSCANSNTAGSCAPGTTVSYYVKPGVKQDFLVLKDNGTTMNLITSEKIGNSRWSTTNSNNTNADALRASLATATSGWDPAARIPSRTDMVNVGCGVWVNNSCPTWLVSAGVFWLDYAWPDMNTHAAHIYVAGRCLAEGSVESVFGIRAVITVQKNNP